MQSLFFFSAFPHAQRAPTEEPTVAPDGRSGTPRTSKPERALENKQTPKARRAGIRTAPIAEDELTIAPQKGFFSFFGLKRIGEADAGGGAGRWGRDGGNQYFARGFSK